MSAAFLDPLNAAAESLVAAGASHFVQSTLLALVLALIDVTVGRRLGAQWRCALWLIFFVKLALPPQLALPSSPAYWLAPAPTASELRTDPVPMMPRMSTDAWTAPGSTDETNAIAAASVQPAAESRSPRLTWPTLLVGAWAAGALALGLATFAQRSRLREALRHSTPAPAELRAALTRAQAEAGCRRRCRIRLVDAAVGPLVAGLWRPTIYLPGRLATNLHPEQLHAVLVHELLHVKRGDLWVTAVQTAARIIFFYHPAVWWVNAHLARLREEATDRAVLAHRHVDAHAYSLALVAAAELGLGARPVSPFALGVIETKSQLRKRIQMNLNQPRSHRVGLGRSGLLSLAVLGLALLPMAPAGLAEPGSRMPAGFQPLDAAATAARIDAASDEIFTAFNQRDRDGYVAAFATDALIMPPGQPLQTGRIGAAEGYLQAPAGLQYEGIRWKDRTCYRIGKWLIDTGLADLQFRLNIDAPMMNDPRQAITFWEEDESGQLQVKVLAWNPLPQPPNFATTSAPRAFALGSAGAPLSTRGDFRAVLEAEEAVHRAFEEKRTSDAAGYYAAEAILFTPETHPLRGHEAIRRYITAVPPERSAQRIERTVAHVEGNENHVLVVNLFRWSFTPAGSSVPVAITGKGVHLWQRESDGSWKIMFDLPNVSQRTGE